MFHLVGYFEDVDQDNILQPITAMADQALNISGDDVTVPPDLNFVGGVALLTAATTLTSAQLRAPSLQTLSNYDISALINADDFADPIAMNYFMQNPIQLDGNEDLQFFTDTDDAAAIEIQGFVYLSDGPVTPVSGNQFTIRCTATISLAQGVWTFGALAFSQTLPVGIYDVVGMRALGANLQAARLVLIGETYRPGVPAVNSAGDSDFMPLRHGNSGVFGRFDSRALPNLEAVGITDSAQTIFLDLIQVS